MPKQKVKVFISSSCGPCQTVKDAIASGKFNLEDVELIDLESDEGFPYIEKMGLSKVPAAFLGKKQCDINVTEDGGIFIDCSPPKPTEPPQPT